MIHLPALAPPKSPRCCRRWATRRPTTATSSAARSRRWPTAAPPTCARSATRQPAMSGRGGDPISALTALLTADGALTSWCGYRYELRLHRARGYGALKAILEILARRRAAHAHRDLAAAASHAGLDQGLSVVARGRRPGRLAQKRYSFTDPLLRLWVRLHCRPVPPTVDEVAREVQAYALARLPQPEPALALATRRRRRAQGLGNHRDRLADQVSTPDSGLGPGSAVSFGRIGPLPFALPLPDSSAARSSRRSSTS